MNLKINQLLNIKYPILQGGMAWASDSKLSTAVSNAGGAGIIGAGGRDINWLKTEIRLAKTLTDKPFGVNIALLSPNHKELIDVVCSEKVSFVTTGAGNPIPFIKQFHAFGIKVIPVVPNVKLAQRVAQAGADAIVIEGMEGGGHIGQLTTMALMSNVLPIIDIPVIVAGGIVDGRGLAAALIMGASGVQMGSRFLMTHEAPTHINAKYAIQNAIDTDSIVTAYGTPDATRGLKNKFTEKFFELVSAGASKDDIIKLATGTNKAAALYGDIENGYVQVGQSLNALNNILSCQEVIDNIIREANKLLYNAPLKML